ncbi:hypothetical protein EV1_001711 [Malus domestica]
MNKARGRTHEWKEKNALMQVSELVSNEQNAAADDGEFSSTDGDSDDDETDTDNELWTRAEEFIEKVRMQRVTTSIHIPTFR